MSEAKVDLTVQDGGAVSAWQRYKAALEAVLHVDQQRTAEDKKAAQAAAELGRIKARVLSEIETKEDRLKTRLVDINRLREAGRLTEEQYGRAVSRTRQQLSEAAAQGNSLSQTAILNAGKFATAIVGVGGVIGGISVAANLLKREWENLKESQKSAADRQVDLVAARDEAIMNIGDDPELAGGKADALIDSASAKTGATRRSLWKAFSGAASFKGDLSNKQAMQAVEQSARLTPTDDAAIQKNTVAQLQLMQEDATVTPEMALGFILKAKEASPTITNEAFASNVVPSIRSGQKFGMSARESAALNATIGASIGDEEGRITATASTQLSKQLAELMPNVEGGTIARLEALQTPEFQKVKTKLLGAFDKEHISKKGAGLEGEAKAFMSMIELIQGGDAKTSQSLQKTLQRMPEIHASGAHFEKVIDTLNANPMRQNMLLKNTLAAGTEGLQLGNVVGARGAISREGLADITKAAGYSDISQKLVQAEFEIATSGGTRDALPVLQDRLRNLGSQKAAGTPQRSYGAGYGVAIVPAQPATPEELRVSKELIALADSLDQLVELQKEQNKDVAEQNVILRGNPAPRPNTLPTGPRPASTLATKP